MLHPVLFLDDIFRDHTLFNKLAAERSMKAWSHMNEIFTTGSYGYESITPHSSHKIKVARPQSYLQN